MGIPNTPEKYGLKAVIDPERVINERKKHGLHPSCSIPAGAVICYDSSLWEWVCGLGGRMECDGWLKGALLLPIGDQRILIMKAAGFGAPTAVLTLEELTAFGITTFLNLGTAGGLQEGMEVGDIVVCERAIRDEGTSYHYLPPAKYAEACPDLTASLCSAIQLGGQAFRVGTSWTTDAPYRETVEEVRRYRAEGVATVEMEASALFAVGQYRGVSVASVFAVSDIVCDSGWTQGYRSEEKSDGLKRIFGAALETIAMNHLGGRKRA